jgi:hypothetical protein
MEAASVPSDGGQPAEGTQQEAGVPAEITQQLDQLNQRFGEVQPVLDWVQQQQAAADQPEEQPEPGFEDYMPEDGYLDPSQLQQAIRAEAEKIASERFGPVQQEVQQIRQQLQDEQLDGLMDQYPELQDPQKAQQLAQQVHSFAQSRSDPSLATDPEVVAMIYLAGKAMEQAQQGVPAGDQGVHLEGGSAQPGQPQVDATQERFKQWAQQGAGGGVWGKNLDQL